MEPHLCMLKRGPSPLGFPLCTVIYGRLQRGARVKLALWGWLTVKFERESSSAPQQGVLARMAAPQIPVTMLSGFLGAGKTTLLRYLLENTSLKVGCIVNDVAGVNIDAKLIRNDRNRDRSGGINTTSDLADTIELANGCACESPSSPTAGIL